MVLCNNNTIKKPWLHKCSAVSCSFLYVYKQNLVSDSNNPPKVTSSRPRAAKTESNEGCYFRNSTVFIHCELFCESCLTPPWLQKMNPAENEKLILNTKCENTESSAQKDHLLFAFVPSKHCFLGKLQIAWILRMTIMWFVCYFVKRNCTNYEDLSFYKSNIIGFFLNFISWGRLTTKTKTLTKH